MTTEDDKARISDRWLWDIAKELHRDSCGGTSNGLHIYFELKRVRDEAIRKRVRDAQKECL